MGFEIADTTYSTSVSGAIKGTDLVYSDPVYFITIDYPYLIHASRFWGISERRIRRDFCNYFKKYNVIKRLYREYGVKNRNNNTGRYRI